MKKIDLNFVIIESFLNEVKELCEDKSVDDLVSKSAKIDDLILDLQSFKKNLRRGPDRHKNRKESSNLQRAIETLRYLRNKNEKLIDELSKED